MVRFLPHRPLGVGKGRAVPAGASLLHPLGALSGVFSLTKVASLIWEHGFPGNGGAGREKAVTPTLALGAPTDLSQTLPRHPRRTDHTQRPPIQQSSPASLTHKKAHKAGASLPAVTQESNHPVYRHRALRRSSLPTLHYLRTCRS